MRHRGLSLMLSVAFAGAAAAQQLSLDEILFRANEYVVGYQKQLVAAVMDESQEQKLVDPSGAIRRTRTLRGVYLLVRPPSEESWLGFQDVFEVDGKPVHERDDRLTKTFAQSGPAGARQAARIAEESARFNLGFVFRALSVPTLALAVLDPVNQHRFNFEKVGDETIEGTPTWMVRFTEQARPTLIRTAGGDLFTRGTFWIAPDSGGVVRSELFAGDANSALRAQTVVTYHRDATLGLWVPAEVRQRYDHPRQPREDTLESVTTFTNVRRIEGTGGK